MSEFKLMTVAEFEKWIKEQVVKRKIKTVQLHHTYSPSYANFTGSNHKQLQQGMKNYHTNTLGWKDIAQHFTVFPDDTIMTGRSLELAPAGISGANTGSICIECVGNFNLGGDTMLISQKNAVAAYVKIILDKFSLSAEKNVTYHAWWGAKGKSLGTYIPGKSQKTCPGTGFFGGNTRVAYDTNLRPMIENYAGGEMCLLKKVESINDIVWELANAGIVTDSKLWIKKCETDKDTYWICYKMANKLRGTL